jgi:GxxExxY protein
MSKRLLWNSRSAAFNSSGEKTVPLFYKDHQIGEHRLDFLVEDRIIVELKAISALEDIHFAIGRSYLKATSLQDGLLLNFATAPLTIKRFYREPSSSPPDFRS